MAEWRNRITRHGEESPDQLCAHPGNWRIHPKMQQEALTGVLHEVGIVQSVIVSERSGYILDGHLRVSLAMREGQPTVPVVYVDLEPHEEALVLATLDPLGAAAATDAAKLDELLREVQTGEAAVQALLSELAMDAGLGADFQPVGIDEQGRLDEKAKVTCPHCGEEFTP